MLIPRIVMSKIRRTLELLTDSRLILRQVAATLVRFSQLGVAIAPRETLKYRPSQRDSM